MAEILETVSRGTVLQPSDPEIEVNRRLRGYAAIAGQFIPRVDRVLLNAAHLLTREHRDFLVRGKGVLCVAVERARALGGQDA